MKFLCDSEKWYPLKIVRYKSVRYTRHFLCEFHRYSAGFTTKCLLNSIPNLDRFDCICNVYFQKKIFDNYRRFSKIKHCLHNSVKTFRTKQCDSFSGFSPKRKKKEQSLKFGVISIFTNNLEMGNPEEISFFLLLFFSPF